LRKEIFSPRSHPSRRDYIHSEANDAICVTTYAITITSKIQSKIARTFIRAQPSRMNANLSDSSSLTGKICEADELSLKRPKLRRVGVAKGNLLESRSKNAREACSAGAGFDNKTCIGSLDTSSASGQTLYRYAHYRRNCRSHCYFCFGRLCHQGGASQTGVLRNCRVSVFTVSLTASPPKLASFCSDSSCLRSRPRGGCAIASSPRVCPHFHRR
jgi:hypothetical protein